jgi:hypothetical protein
VAGFVGQCSEGVRLLVSSKQQKKRKGSSQQQHDIGMNSGLV